MTAHEILGPLPEPPPSIAQLVAALNTTAQPPRPGQEPDTFEASDGLRVQLLEVVDQSPYDRGYIVAVEEAPGQGLYFDTKQAALRRIACAMITHGASGAAAPR